MRRALFATVLAVATAFSGSSAMADETQQRLPVNDPGVTGKVAALNKCVSESQYDAPEYYGDKCVRLKVVFGPIVVNPGKNDVLIQPVTFEKPMWDGYMTRFKPGLIGPDGFAPPVENLHLHHGTWLNPGYFGGGNSETTTGGLPNPGRQYGWGPWLATGEEKTIVASPYRYGLKIKGTDAWLFLHMVHSALASPTVVWVTYDIDYIALPDAEAIQLDGKPLIRNTKGIWLDVGGGAPWSNGQRNNDTYPNNPVYNVHKGFGSSSLGTANEYKVPPAVADAFEVEDPDSGALRVCSWPDENCARENSSGVRSNQQGVAVDTAGSDFTIPAGNDGTIVVMGGHLHMGGTNDTVELVRTIDGKEFSRIVHISDGYYWNWENPDLVGAPPISWDVSMSGVSADFGWKLKVKAGDKIRLNAVYDADIASWLENMGIVMAWLAVGDDTGTDVFRGCQNVDGALSGCEVSVQHGLIADRNEDDANAPVVRSEEVYTPITASGYDNVRPIRINRPAAAPGWTAPGADLPPCVPGPDTLCTRGQITHGHVPSSDNHRGCYGTLCNDTRLLDAARAAGPGEFISEIHMAGFLYSAGDFGAIGLTGIPRVKLGDSITFYNEDMAMTVPHTATACRYPCTGPVTTHYPIPDAAVPVIATPDTNDDPSFTVEDPSGSAALDAMDFDTTEIGYHLGASQRSTYVLKATRTGTFTYFCRIHPFMRGVFEVVN